MKPGRYGWDKVELDRESDASTPAKVRRQTSSSSANAYNLKMGKEYCAGETVDYADR